MKVAALWLCAASYIIVGVGHFTDPDPFVSIVPPYLPAPLLLVHISGFFEVLGGLGLLIPNTRRAAGWGILALLVAVYPANIHMLVNEVYLEAGDYDEGRFGSHTHSTTCVMSSLAQLADLTGDASLMNRVRAFYDNGLWVLD